MILREITQKDRPFIIKVRNNPAVQKMSHKSESCIIIWKNKKVGYVTRSKGLISIAILPKYHNKYIGTITLKSFCKTGDRAEILVGNIASEKVFKRAGFKPEYTVYVKG